MSACQPMRMHYPSTIRSDSLIALMYSCQVTQFDQVHWRQDRSNQAQRIPV